MTAAEAVEPALRLARKGSDEQISRESRILAPVRPGLQAAGLQCLKLQIGVASPETQTRAFPGTELSRKIRSPKECLPCGRAQGKWAVQVETQGVKFCGAVTGQISGTIPEVELVAAFELPQDRIQIPRIPMPSTTAHRHSVVERLWAEER